MTFNFIRKNEDASVEVTYNVYKSFAISNVKACLNARYRFRYLNSSVAMTLLKLEDSTRRERHNARARYVSV